MPSTDQLTLENSLLGLLAEQPAHGYELYQRFSEAAGLGMVWHLKQGLLYALLARLDKRGYVTHTLEQQESRPPRKVYALTSKGEATFQDWLRTPVPHGRDVRIEFLAKLYFARRRGSTALRTLCRAQRTECQLWLAALEAAVEELAPESYPAMVYGYRAGQIRAIITWLDDVAATAAEPSTSIGG